MKSVTPFLYVNLVKMINKYVAIINFVYHIRFMGCIYQLSLVSHRYYY